MQINPEALAAIYFNFRLGFDKAYAETPTFWNKVAMLMPSSTRENRYPWLKLMPRMREWIGERVFNNLVARSYSIVNKPFELSLEIDRDDILDDNLGVYAPGIAMMGQQSAKWPDDRVAIALQEGTTAECFDGQPFFDESHPVDLDDPSKGTYANLFGDMELNAENYRAARANMMLINGEDGKPLGLTPSLLVVPPQLEERAKQILNADFIAPTVGVGINGVYPQRNLLVGTADPVVIPEIGNEEDTWYLFDATKPIKAIIWQLRQAPVMTALTSPTDVNVFLEKKFLYGTDSRGNHGYSLPFLGARYQASSL